MIKVDRTTAARAIKKLEEKGFIRKEADDVNKKNSTVICNRRWRKASSDHSTRKSIFQSNRFAKPVKKGN